MQIKDILTRLSATLENYYTIQDEGVFVKHHSPNELRLSLPLDKQGDADWNELFAWVELYLANSVKTGHPGFVNRMWCDANLPSIIGEIVTAFSNTSACTYESAPVSTVMEHYLIDQMLDIVGFADGEGQMTTGSSNANMISMLAARNTHTVNSKKNGLHLQRQLFAFVSEDAHYSLDKAANIIGIGTDHLIKVTVGDHGKMDVVSLENSIVQVIKAGGIPFYVCATAGTTVRGAYDPLNQLLKLRDKYSFWMHVDGAWGGAVVFNEHLREIFLQEIERVDSFTWDFHKMLGTSLICNILLFNNRSGILGKTCLAGDGSYIFRGDDDQYISDLGSISLQCGRRVDSLKWFLDWKFYGKKGFGQRVEHLYELCCYAEDIVNKTPELEMVVPRESFNVCFCYLNTDNSTINDFNKKLRRQLYEDGVSLVGYGFIGEKLALRLLITHASFQREDVDSFFTTLVETGKKMIRNVR